MRAAETERNAGWRFLAARDTGEESGAGDQCLFIGDSELAILQYNRQAGGRWPCGWGGRGLIR